MTTFNWSSLTNGQVVTFVVGSDVIYFDDPAISAAAIGFSFTPTATDATNGRFTLSYEGKTVTFGTAVSNPVPFAALTTTTLIFADGSQFLIGDNTTGVGSDDSANTLTGTSGNDAFAGLGGADTLNGGDGNDVFYAAYSGANIGNDSINGGNGIDTLFYNTNSTAAALVNLASHTAVSTQGSLLISSIEVVTGTAGNDTFVGGDTAHATDQLGNRATERFRGNAGNDTITGGAGTSFFTIADYANNSSGQAISVNLLAGTASDGRGGTDTLVNIDAVNAGAGDDMIVGGSLSRSASGTFFEQFRGNAGNDTINGNNSALGDHGYSDRADYSNNTVAQAVNADLSTGLVLDGLGGTDTLIDISMLLTGAGNDTINGSSINEDFDGGRGNDIINGGGGSDSVRYQASSAGVIVNLSASSITVNSVTVAAGTGNDGMGGTDTLISIENIRGSDFDDYLRGSDDTTVWNFLTGAAGNDTLNGGLGIDIASYASNATIHGGVNGFVENGAGVIADKLGGTDTLIGIEGLSGTQTGDTLSGGVGTQYFYGNGGNDQINGGAGSDWVLYSNDPLAVTVNLGTGIATDGWNGFGGLLGLGGIDTLVSIENAVGSDYDDILIGSSGSNILVGNQGSDQINGGAGNDTARFGVHSGNATWRYNADGTWTITTASEGIDTLSNIEKVQFSERELRLWRLEGEDLAGDFNGDGRDDILWRNSSGAVETWLSSATGSVASIGSGMNQGFGYTVAGVGDFNGNGTDDIAWRGADGSVQIWSMTNGTGSVAATLGSSLDWHVHAIADFNGDNVDDILWRNANSDTLALWQMGNFEPVGGGAIATVSGAWRLLGSGDFNGDLKDDLLWYNADNNALSIWEMNGATQIGGGVLGVLDNTWSVQGIGDFNGDGRDDILWRHTSGALAQWQMNGTTVINSALFNSATPDWTVQGVGQFDSGATSDILLRDAVSGAVALWSMNGTTISNSQILGTSSSDWIVL